MADDPKPETTEPETTGDTPTAPTQADLDKWRALARKHEKAAKDNADAARELAELKEKDKSEAERASEAAAAAVARADKAERELLRLSIAAEKGLTPAQAKRLHGDTEDELRADADELVEQFRPATPVAGGSGRPREQLVREVAAGGGDPTDPPVELDPDKLAAAISAEQ